MSLLVGKNVHLTSRPGVYLHCQEELIFFIISLSFFFFFFFFSFLIVRIFIYVVFFSICLHLDNLTTNKHICSPVVSLVSIFLCHINLHGLLNTEVVLVEEQYSYYLTHNWKGGGDKGVHTFPKSISQKVNVIG